MFKKNLKNCLFQKETIVEGSQMSDAVDSELRSEDVDSLLTLTKILSGNPVENFKELNSKRDNSKWMMLRTRKSESKAPLSLVIIRENEEMGPEAEMEPHFESPIDLKNDDSELTRRESALLEILGQH